MAIKLYDLVGEDPARPFSPHCWKVAFALAHKGLPFERVPTPFTTIADIESGASKTIPVIRDGDAIIRDSFAIAVYLEETYPDLPTLFGGEGGRAAARFIERWSLSAVHPHVVTTALLDIHAMLSPQDQAYFRQSREARFGRPLEEVAAGRDEARATLHAALEPLRSMLAVQPFIGGERPLFSDYIVAGAFQWLRVVSRFRVLEEGDPVSVWFERCLDLHRGLGRSVAAAA